MIGIAVKQARQTVAQFILAPLFRQHPFAKPPPQAADEAFLCEHAGFGEQPQRLLAAKQPDQRIAQARTHRRILTHALGQTLQLPLSALGLLRSPWAPRGDQRDPCPQRSEEHTSELPSLKRHSLALLRLNTH